MRLLNLRKNTTQSEMAELWGNVSRQTIHLALKILDLHEKKIYEYKERSEEKQAEFLKNIATKHTENLVYIDESGIDNIEDYEY